MLTELLKSPEASERAAKRSAAILAAAAQLRLRALNIFNAGAVPTLLRPRWPRSGAALALAAALAAGLLSTVSAAGVKVGDTFPDLASFKLEGKLPELKDKVVMIDFWASWCDPCKESFSVLDELQKRHGTNGLVVIAVNVDDNRADMEAFLKKHPATFTIVRDAAQKLVEKTGIATMPSSFLVDRDGKVRFTHPGFRGEETKKKYEQEIQSLLKK